MPNEFLPKAAKENVTLQNDEQELPKTLLSREAYLLGGGIKDGILERLKQTQENPALTTVEFAGTIALGFGLTAMNNAGGHWAAASRVGSGALKILAVGDGIRRLVPTAYAMGDTMVNPDHYLENRSTVAKYLGTACFDYSLMGAGGYLGSRATGLVPKVTASAESFRATSEGLAPKNL